MTATLEISPISTLTKAIRLQAEPFDYLSRHIEKHPEEGAIELELLNAIKGLA